MMTPEVDLDDSYDKVVRLLEERKRKMRKLNTMLLCLYGVTVVLLFIGASL